MKLIWAEEVTATHALAELVILETVTSVERAAFALVIAWLMTSWSPIFAICTVRGLFSEQTSIILIAGGKLLQESVI